MNVEVGKRSRGKERNNSNRPDTSNKCDFCAEIVSPTSVSTATSDAAIIQQTGQPGCTPVIKLDQRRPYDSWIKERPHSHKISPKMVNPRDIARNAEEEEESISVVSKALEIAVRVS